MTGSFKNQQIITYHNIEDLKMDLKKKKKTFEGKRPNLHLESLYSDQLHIMISIDKGTGKLKSQNMTEYMEIYC